MYTTDLLVFTWNDSFVEFLAIIIYNPREPVAWFAIGYRVLY